MIGMGKHISAVLCLVAQSCPTLRPLDCSLPHSSVHGILQARILEWVAMPSSRGSSQPRDQTQVSHITGELFTIWATREALLESSCSLMLSRVLKYNSHQKSWPHLDTRKQLFMTSQKLVVDYQTRTRLLSCVKVGPTLLVQVMIQNSGKDLGYG